MFDFQRVSELYQVEFDALRDEAHKLADLFHENDFFDDPRKFQHAHYGYLMACMGRVDQYSALWKGTLQGDRTDQTQRMIDFLAEFVYPLPSHVRIHCYGMFFYFQAPRAGEGKRHFWRYIDARPHEIKENRYEIAQLISCLPDEPRYIGDQDVFMLQDKVIEHILAADREAEAKAAAPIAVDPIQQTVSEEIKDAIRRRTVDREKAKACINFLGQPMGRALHVKLKAAQESWKASGGDTPWSRKWWRSRSSSASSTYQMAL